jgi:hypothetical protein
MHKAAGAHRALVLVVVQRGRADSALERSRIIVRWGHTVRLDLHAASLRQHAAEDPLPPQQRAEANRDHGL